jgi:hypothetical protein
MSTDWPVYEYEASMYVDIVNLCAKGDHRLHPHPIPNAIMGSLLMHTRNLIDIIGERHQLKSRAHYVERSSSIAIREPSPA